jgi:hypothetical protein
MTTPRLRAKFVRLHDFAPDEDDYFATPFWIGNRICEPRIALFAAVTNTI